MSKLSPGLKALINAPFARPDPTPAPARIRDLFQAIARDAAKHNVGFKPWVALSVRLFPIYYYYPLLLTSPERCHLYSQLPRIPHYPPRRRLLVITTTRPISPPNSRIDPRGRPQMHLLQWNPPLHQLPQRLPRLSPRRNHLAARDGPLARADP